MKKIGHVKTLLFTISNSWPIFFGKDSFWSLIIVFFISVNEHCAKYSGNLWRPVLVKMTYFYCLFFIYFDSLLELLLPRV